MCGIFGLFAPRTNAELIDFKKARLASTYILNRGPDNYEEKTFDSCFLAHSRLSIVSRTPRANQPLSDDSGRYHLVFNGEIYNYKKIKSKLERHGVEIYDNSDTEVLLKALIMWNTDTFKFLDGMYAIAFFDSHEQSVLLARDPIGVKPLFYSYHKHVLAFASLPFAIVSYFRESCNFLFSQLCSQLFFRSNFGRETLIKGIKCLLPGEVLSINSSGEIESHSMIPDNYHPKKVGFEPSIITKSVGMQIPNDIPFAALLSGGIDSSLLAYEIQQFAPNRCDFFCGKVLGSNYDETDFAIEVSNQLGLKLNIIEIEQEFSYESIEHLLQYRQWPLAMHNELAMYQLSKAISSKSFKIMFTGEGADEAFGGYSRLFRLGYDIKRFNLLKRSRVPCVTKYLELTDIVPGNFIRTLLNRYAYFPILHFKEILHYQYIAELDSTLENITDFFQDLISSQNATTPFEQLTAIMLRYHLPSLLSMVDGTSMACGVEARVPFASPNIIRMALGLRETEKLKWNSTTDRFIAMFFPISKFSELKDVSKWCLKNAYRDKLPLSVIKRTKKGFPTPMNRFRNSTIAHYYINEISKGHAYINEWICPQKFERWSKQAKNIYDDNFGKQLWLLINLEIYSQKLKELIRI